MAHINFPNPAAADLGWKLTEYFLQVLVTTLSISFLQWLPLGSKIQNLTLCDAPKVHSATTYQFHLFSLIASINIW